MRLGNLREVDEPEINLISLIDVLFCLILFLVLTTSFNQRAALKVQLPQAQAGIVPDAPGWGRSLCANLDQPDARAWVAHRSRPARVAGATCPARRKVEGSLDHTYDRPSGVS